MVLGSSAHLIPTACFARLDASPMIDPTSSPNTAPNGDATPSSPSPSSPVPSVQLQPVVNAPAVSTPSSNTTPSIQPTDVPASRSPSKKKKKRGNQGKFSGPQLAFLQSRIDAYLALSTRKERSKWIVSTTHEYFQTFPWHTKSEPAEFAILHDDSASLPDQQRQELEAARDEALSATVKQGQTELKNWIHRQTQRPAERNGGEAFKRINNQLKQTTALKKPRWKPDYKHFMSHPEFRDQFMEHY
ncbi:hypothetical protein F5878DRAFT_647536, partial [Lentinula raphanica]